MGNRKTGSRLATGLWSERPRKHIHALQIPDKIEVNLQEKLLTGGRPANLWLPVTSGLACTCVKETASVADRRCGTCYGTGFAPGYRRFLHEDLFFASAESASFALTNVVLNTRTKPHTLELASTALTGTITTAAKAYANPGGDAWTYDVRSYVDGLGGAVSAEFSTNGVNWYALSTINGANRPVASGNVRVRVTLTRPNLDTASPEFEVVRLRHLNSQNVNPVIGRRFWHPEYAPGNILFLRPWETERKSSEAVLGVQVNNSGEKSWTCPLNWFDRSIARDTPAAKIDDTLPGSHPFLEHAFGIHTGERFALFEASWNEQLFVFTHQSFRQRRVQPNELYHLVW